MLSHFTIEEKLEFLECLLACGVDNWDGWSDAWQLYESYTNPSESEDE